MAILVRAGTEDIPRLQRALIAAGIPVEVPASDLPLGEDPALAPLLIGLRLADRPGEVSADEVAEFLCSPLVGMTPLELRQVGLGHCGLPTGGRRSPNGVLSGRRQTCLPGSSPAIPTNCWSSHRTCRRCSRRPFRCWGRCGRPAPIGCVSSCGVSGRWVVRATPPTPCPAGVGRDTCGEAPWRAAARAARPTVRWTPSPRCSRSPTDYPSAPGSRTSSRLCGTNRFRRHAPTTVHGTETRSG